MARRPSTQTRTVLDHLARTPADWCHGYDISRQTGIASGTLYPILMRLAERGYLESRWEEPQTPGRPRRHAYRLTAAGRRYAAEWPRPAARSIAVHPAGEGAAG